MRNIVWLLLLCVAAVVAALTLGDNDGLASFYWGGWRVDFSLNFFLLLAFAAGMITLSVVQGLSSLIGLPARARLWRTQRYERAAHAALHEALTEYFSGRYTRSHKAATRALSIRTEGDSEAGTPEFRALAKLLAAGSLHRLQDKPRRDELLQQVLGAGAGQVPPAVGEGARLLAAEWALDDRDEPRATALLGELTPGAARRTQALRLKLQAARQARRPGDALSTARLLAKHQAFSEVAAQGLLRSLSFEVLDAARDIEQLRRAWAELDGADRRDPFVAAHAARRAAALGVPADGRLWLQPHWDRIDELSSDGRAQIALALAEASAGVGADWLPRVEAAQLAHVKEGAVQAAAGTVLVACKLWGKARRPLELATQDAGLSARARRHAWRLLAQLAAEQGDDERAAICNFSAASID